MERDYVDESGLKRSVCATWVATSKTSTVQIFNDYSYGMSPFLKANGDKGHDGSEVRTAKIVYSLNDRNGSRISLEVHCLSCMEIERIFCRSMARRSSIVPAIKRVVLGKIQFSRTVWSSTFRL